MQTAAREIVRRLRGTGHDAYWVGGCVRDFLLQQKPKDYDIATSARPETVLALFPQSRPVGRQFGVVLVSLNRIWFEVATFRSESGYEDGRHPSRVAFGDAQADARRRDFTINGLFFDPMTGRVFDWVDGQQDLRDRLIRTIGDPQERFAEDHLRLLRAIRFAATLNFSLEADTSNAIRLLAPRIRLVSAERIRDELLRLFLPPHAARGLDGLRHNGLLDHVLPEVAATIPCEQPPESHPEGTVYQHLLKMLTVLPANASSVLVWAVLLHDIGKPATASRDPISQSIHFFRHEQVGATLAGALLKRLRFPRRRLEEITTCVRMHMQLKDALQMRKATLRRMLLRPTFPTELQLHRLDCLASHGQLDIYQFLQRESEALRRTPTLRPPLLTGRDLLDMGMQEGPHLGSLLAEIREKQLQDELKTAEEARRWVGDRLGATPKSI
ncbi:MAG TPA: CCA tRNA nucleotidyltransferase [Candidatus Paceibacterota bacterium]|nr:CCA tRNA nucleotidyltransferase [Verrucomicrobiota bacterium]HRY49297.1 CCA tRNA nucleotidyltransferase [Candidatus Paceibacterota bacterium]